MHEHKDFCRHKENDSYYNLISCPIQTVTFKPFMTLKDLLAVVKVTIKNLLSFS